MTKRKNKKKKVYQYVVEATSKSGDDYGEIGRFDHDPTEKDLKKILHKKVIGDDGWSEEEEKLGPGACGSWLHVFIKKEEHKMIDILTLNEHCSGKTIQSFDIHGEARDDGDLGCVQMLTIYFTDFTKVNIEIAEDTYGDYVLQVV